MSSAYDVRKIPKKMNYRVQTKLECKKAIRQTWAGLVICLFLIIGLGVATVAVKQRERAERAAVNATR